jgi:hypothetical protein
METTEKLTPEAIYETLLAESQRKKLPESYATDLSAHDRRDLHETRTQDFIWVLRTNGTHLILLDAIKEPLPPTASIVPNHPTYTVRALKDTFNDNEKHWYHFSNGQLVPIDYNNALTLAEDAEEKVRAANALYRHLMRVPSNGRNV